MPEAQKKQITPALREKAGHRYAKLRGNYVRLRGNYEFVTCLLSVHFLGVLRPKVGQTKKNRCWGARAEHEGEAKEPRGDKEGQKMPEAQKIQITPALREKAGHRYDKFRANYVKFRARYVFITCLIFVAYFGGYYFNEVT